MLCQASVRSRLSKGYLDHDICRWKTGKQFNATGMCTVHSVAFYVHIQMLDDVSLSLFHQAYVISLFLLDVDCYKDWLELSQRYPQLTFVTVRQPHLPLSPLVRSPKACDIRMSRGSSRSRQSKTSFESWKRKLYIEFFPLRNATEIHRVSPLFKIQDGGLPYCDKRFKKQRSAQEQQIMILRQQSDSSAGAEVLQEISRLSTPTIYT